MFASINARMLSFGSTETQVDVFTMRTSEFMSIFNTNIYEFVFFRRDIA